MQFGTASRRRSGVALLVMIGVALAASACGGGPPAEAPANQRISYERSGIVLHWDETEDAEFYKVYFSESPDPGCRVESGAPQSCVEIAGDIPFGWFEDPSEYRFNRERNFYWVTACNDHGCAAIDSANPALSPPPRPRNLRAALDGSSIVVEWDEVPEATHYGSLMDCGGSRGCRVLIELVHDTTARYTPPPPRPYGLRVTERSTDSLVVQWPPVHEQFHGRYELQLSACNEVGCSRPSAVSDPGEATVDYSFVGEYQVHRRSERGQFELVDATATRTEFIDLDVRPDTVYFYKLQYCSDVECSALSEETGGVTEAIGAVDPPAVPGGFRGEKIDIGGAGDDARVLWNASEGATWYEVFQDDDATWPDAEISAPQTSYRDSSPNRGTFGTYLTTSYRVRACNQAGCSGLTEFVTLD